MMLEANIVPRRFELGYRTLQLVGSLFGRLHRQRRNAHEALRILLYQFGNLVVLDGGRIAPSEASWL